MKQNISIICGEPGTGKSKELILKAEEENIKYIVCSDPPRHYELALSLGVTSISFLTIENALDIINKELFYIDDIEKIFPKLKAFTINLL